MARDISQNEVDFRALLEVLKSGDTSWWDELPDRTKRLINLSSGLHGYESYEAAEEIIKGGWKFENLDVDDTPYYQAEKVLRALNDEDAWSY